MAGDGPRARRHRGNRLRDPPAPAGLGGLRPPRGIHRSDGRLPHLRASLPGGQARGRAVRAQAVEAPGRVLRVRPHRRARVQPDVRDPRRAGEGHGVDGLPAPRDGAGDLHQLQERPSVRAQEAAVRDRADRQVLPQRDHDRKLRLPHARVRADGDGVLRPAGRGAQMAPVLDGPAHALVHGPRHPAGQPEAPPARRRRALALLIRDLGRGVPVPDGLVGARGDRESGRLRPDPARERVRREARVLRPGEGRGLRPVRDRARRRRGPRDFSVISCNDIA